METVRKFIMVMMVLLPGTLFGATDCKIADYPDHYEVVCLGDEKPGSVPVSTVVRVQANIADPATARTPSTVTAQADAGKLPIIARMGRRPNQAALSEAKAARNKLIREEQQKEPAEIAVPVTMQD